MARRPAELCAEALAAAVRGIEGASVTVDTSGEVPRVSVLCTRAACGAVMRELGRAWVRGCPNDAVRLTVDCDPGAKATGRSVW